MTAIKIAKNVTASIGIEEPSTLVGAAQVGSASLLVLLNRGCRILARKRGPNGESWPELTRELSLTTVADQEYYALPQDFSQLISDTAWDRTTYLQGVGPLSPQEWAAIKGSLVSSALYTLAPRYRVTYDHTNHRRAIRLDPTPTVDGEVVAFEYISTYWCRTSEGGAIDRDRISSDSHEPVFPDDLVEMDLEWRLRKADGMSYQADVAEFEMERDRVFSQLVSSGSVMINGALLRDPWLGDVGVVVSSD